MILSVATVAEWNEWIGIAFPLEVLAGPAMVARPISKSRGPESRRSTAFRDDPAIGSAATSNANPSSGTPASFGRSPDFDSAHVGPTQLILAERCLDSTGHVVSIMHSKTLSARGCILFHGMTTTIANLTSDSVSGVARIDATGGVA